jgi:hypothetical protein
MSPSRGSNRRFPSPTLNPAEVANWESTKDLSLMIGEGGGTTTPSPPLSTDRRNRCGESGIRGVRLLSLRREARGALFLVGSGGGWGAKRGSSRRVSSGKGSATASVEISGDRITSMPPMERQIRLILPSIYSSEQLFGAEESGRILDKLQTAT